MSLRALTVREALAATAILFLAAGLYLAASRDVLTLDSLMKHGAAFQDLVADRYLFAALAFIAAYTAAILILIPGALWFATLGGFMFGSAFGTVYASIATTLGTTAVFVLARYVFGHWMHLRAGRFLQKMRAGFRQDGFSYLLAIRLMPMFPFVAANVVPAALDVTFKTYAVATFVGMLPWTFMHVLVGVGLRDALRSGEVIPSADLLLRPKVLAGLIGVALLSLAPIAYRRFRPLRHVH